MIDTLQTGGAERSLLQIIGRFKRYRPVVIILFKKSHDLKADYVKAGIEVIELNLTNTWAFWKLADQALEKVAHLKPMLIHATLFKSDMTSRYLATKMSVPLINSFVNNSYSKQRYQAEPWLIKLKLKVLQEWDSFTATKVDLFISNSEVIKRTNANALRIPVTKIKVIHRGRESNAYQLSTSAQRNALRNELKVTHERVFLNVSRLIDRKGQLDLIKAFYLLTQRESNVILWIVGQGPLKKELELEIERLKLSDKVFLLGNRNDVAALLKAADYFSFPSHYEGLPGVLIEAMMARIPIIASYIPENLECIMEPMALFHKPGDSIELASKLQIAASMSAQEWEVKIEEAYQFAKNNFEINNIAAEYESAYDVLLKSRN